MSATIDQKKKARLVKSIGLNVFISLLVLSFIFFYILPSYKEIAIKREAANTAVKSLNDMTQNGVDIAKYEALIAKYAQIRKSEKPDPEQQKLVVEALKKPAQESEDYLSWVKKELSKESSINLEIDRNNRIIASSIPTFSDVLNTSWDEFLKAQLTKSQITLTDLNAYVEQSLFKKHSVESFSSVGFGNVSFDNKTNTALNIGTYKLTVDVKGLNKNLLNLVDTIQKSGEISIKDGKLVETATNSTDSGSISLAPKFDNLLTTIDSVTFANSLEDPERENTANMSLLLYVRARNLSDLVNLRLQLVEKLKALVADVTKVSELCSDLSRAECKNEAVIKSVQSVRSLRNDANELLKNAEEKAKSTNTGDITTEFSALVDQFTTTSNIQSQVTAATNIIENTRKQITK